MSAAGEIYALLIGINDYGEAMPSLQFAVADVLAVPRVSARANGHETDNCSILTFPIPVRASCRNEITCSQNWTGSPRHRWGRNDTFVLYFAGHGFARTRPATCWRLTRIPALPIFCGKRRSHWKQCMSFFPRFVPASNC